jgi:hypothetical protein
VELAQYQIAFSRMGLNFLGVEEGTGDARFDHRAMRDDKPILGDGSPWATIFEKTNFDPVNGSANNDNGTGVHGVITVAASSKYLLQRSSWRIS